MPKTRTARFSKSGIGLFLTLPFVLVVLACQSEPEPQPVSEPAVEVPIQERWTTVVDTVRRGDTFSGVLLRNRVGVQEIADILGEMREKELFSPRSLRPGQVLSISRDAYGYFQQLRFHISREEILSFEPDGDSLFAQFEDVDREVRLRKFDGEVLSSFDAAVRRAGGDYRLTLKVADLLAYDIDFFTEVREHDRFEMLVEEKFVEGEFLGYGDVLYVAYDGRVADCEAIYYEWGDDRNGYYQTDGAAMKKAFLKSPLNYRRISSHFGRRFHPVHGIYKHHSGVDFAARTGTPVAALGDGVVDYRGWKGGYGNTVRLKHQGRIQTLYGHLKGFAKGLKRGDRVEQGEVIGYVGQTGVATGPHLHFEVIENGRQIDPLEFRSEPAEPLPAEQLPGFFNWVEHVRDLRQDMVAGQIVPTIEPRSYSTDLALGVTQPR